MSDILHMTRRDGRLFWNLSAFLVFSARWIVIKCYNTHRVRFIHLPLQHLFRHLFLGQSDLRMQTVSSIESDSVPNVNIHNGPQATIVTVNSTTTPSVAIP